MQKQRKAPLLILLTCLLQHIWCCQDIPPKIVLQPKIEIPFEAFSEVTLRCEATGEPKPEYEWFKDGKPLFIDGVHIRDKPESGSITIKDLSESDEGYYQCHARNYLGVAVSIKSHLQLAYIDPFMVQSNKIVHKVKIGSPLSLSCNPPRSYPEGSYKWLLRDPEEEGDYWLPILYNSRVSMDPTGNLHFANIRMADSQQGKEYVCAVTNNVTHTTVIGNNQFIEPVQSLNVEEQPPRLQWIPPSYTMALKGSVMRMKCIFSGYPTPTVSWTRLDETMNPGAKMESFGQELIIPDVSLSDQGNYQCKATNGVDEPMTRNFEVTVRAAPYVNEPMIEDIQASVGDTVTIKCSASGLPEPVNRWILNGEPLLSAPPVNFIVTDNGEVLIITEVTQSDTGVIQCNATNYFGYLLQSTRLVVH